MIRRILPSVLGLCVVASAWSEPIFKVDLSTGTPGQEVKTDDNAVPDPWPGKEITYVAKAQGVSLKLAADGALPGQYALLTDKGPGNLSFLLRWAEDLEGKVVKSGVLTVSWTMNYVSGDGSDVSFQIIRPDLPKEAGRIARINVSAAGSVKIGGSTSEGAAEDSRATKKFTLGTPHQFVWTLDFANGIQTLKIDDGKLLDYSSTSTPQINFFAAPAVAFKVEVRGDDAVVAFDDFSISKN